MEEYESRDGFGAKRTLVVQLTGESSRQCQLRRVRVAKTKNGIRWSDRQQEVVCRVNEEEVKRTYGSKSQEEPCRAKKNQGIVQPREQSSEQSSE